MEHDEHLEAAREAPATWYERMFLRAGTKYQPLAQNDAPGDGAGGNGQSGGGRNSHAHRNLSASGDGAAASRRKSLRGRGRRRGSTQVMITTFAKIH